MYRPLIPLVLVLIACVLFALSGCKTCDNKLERTIKVTNQEPWNKLTTEASVTLTQSW